MPLAPEAPGRSRASGLPVANPPEAGTLSRLGAALAFALKLGLFALVFVFALRNNEPVTLRLLPGYDWSTSLALALVGSLCVGALLGVLAMSGHALRLRRRALRAEGELEASRVSPTSGQDITGQGGGRGV